MCLCSLLVSLATYIKVFTIVDCTAWPQWTPYFPIAYLVPCSYSLLPIANLTMFT